MMVTKMLNGKSTKQVNKTILVIFLRKENSNYFILLFIF